MREPLRPVGAAALPERNGKQRRALKRHRVHRRPEAAPVGTGLSYRVNRGRRRHQVWAPGDQGRVGPEAEMDTDRTQMVTRVHLCV